MAVAATTPDSSRAESRQEDPRAVVIARPETVLDQGQCDVWEQLRGLAAWHKYHCDCDEVRIDRIIVKPHRRGETNAARAPGRDA